jgi:hypothetical protein
MKCKIFAAGISTARPEPLISRPMRRVKALGHRVYRISLQGLKSPQSL